MNPAGHTVRVVLHIASGTGTVTYVAELVDTHTDAVLWDTYPQPSPWLALKELALRLYRRLDGGSA